MASESQIVTLSNKKTKTENGKKNFKKGKLEFIKNTQFIKYTAH